MSNANIRRIIPVKHSPVDSIQTINVSNLSATPSTFSPTNSAVNRQISSQQQDRSLLNSGKPIGVSIFFLLAINSYLKSESVENLTTAEVVEQYIKPWLIISDNNDEATSSHSTSLVEHVLEHKFASKISIDLNIVFDRTYISTATVYVSHCWSYSFDGLVHSLATYHDEHEQDNLFANIPKAFYWIDIFSTNLSNIISPPNQSDLITLMQNIGHFCVVLMPWRSPVIFRRTWCLYEIYLSHIAGVPFSIQLSKKRHEKFLDLIAESYDSAIRSLNPVIDIENSCAYSQEDHDFIFNTFHNLLNGVPEVIDIISKLINEWICKEGIRLIEKKILKTEEVIDAIQVQGVKKITYSEIFCYAFGCREITDDVILNPVQRQQKASIELIKTKMNYAIMLNELKQYDEAEQVYKEVIAANSELFGDDYPSSLSVIGNLATLYKSQNRFNDADLLYNSVIEKKKQVLGDIHPSTLTSMYNLAVLYKENNQYDKSIELLQYVTVEQSQILGPDHPDTIMSSEILGNIYLLTNQEEEAKAILETVLMKKQNKFGNKHNETLSTYETLGVLYVKEGLIEEAIDVFMNALPIREMMYGNRHPISIAICNNLAKLYRKNGDLISSYTYYERVLENALLLNGAKHVIVFDLQQSMAEILLETDQFNEAEPLLLDLLGRMCDFYKCPIPPFPDASADNSGNIGPTISSDTTQPSSPVAVIMIGSQVGVSNKDGITPKYSSAPHTAIKSQFSNNNNNNQGSSLLPSSASQLHQPMSPPSNINIPPITIPSSAPAGLTLANPSTTAVTPSSPSSTLATVPTVLYHQKIFNILYLIADLYLQLNNYEFAAHYHKLLYDQRCYVYGTEHGDSLLSLYGLASSLVYLHRFKEGRAYFEQVLQSFDNALGEDSPKSLSTVESLANICKVIGDYRHAEQYYQRLINHYTETLGSHHTTTMNFMRSLANIYS
eukprot:gene9267-12483_t